MIIPSPSPADPDAAPRYQLRIHLIGSRPSIWRRLSVPGDARLDWLHAALQIAFGWTNSHLHHFVCGETIYSDSRQVDEIWPGMPEELEESDHLLMDVAPMKGLVLVYEYDFGDCWLHQIRVEKIVPASAGKPSAVCLAGALAGPPEDSGGIGGYAEKIKIARNPMHPEHEEMMEWLGKKFDPKAFDVARTNHWLAKLRWPRVTDEALVRILMAQQRAKR